MSSKTAEFQLRKDRILAFTIEHYIKKVLPVSSQLLAHEYQLDLSSATIRNILAELEEEGYLTHPHTSAGRVPTEEGYRYYVNNLMKEISLLEGEKQRIKKEYDQATTELESLLEKTSEVLSDLTHYTSIVSIDGGNRIFCKGTSYVVSYPDFQDFNKIKDILTVLDEKERLMRIINKHLENKIDIFIGQELALREFDNCSIAISRYQIKKGLSGRLAVLGPTRMNYKRVISSLDYISELMEKIL